MGLVLVIVFVFVLGCYDNLFKELVLISFNVKLGFKYFIFYCFYVIFVFRELFSYL